MVDHSELARAALRRLWAWLTGAGYRPERRYMRGGRARQAQPSWRGPRARAPLRPRPM